MNGPRIEALAPLDYVYFEKPQYTMNFVFEFGQPQDFAAMQAGLAKVLEKFHPLKGRVQAAADGKYQIVEDISNPLGALPFECRTLAKADEPTQGRDLLALSESVGASEGNPLAKFVLYQMAERSALSASISHGIADGFSYFFFLASWAAATRGGELPPPAHQRQLVRCEGADYGDLSARSVFERSGYSLLDRSGLSPAPLKTYESVTFTDADLSAEREQAERELGRKLSRNDVITALLLKDCARRWHERGDTIRLTCQFDTRRLMPKIAPTFFGNGTRGASFDATFDEIMDMGLGALASRVQHSVARIDRAEVEDGVRCIQGIGEVHGLDQTRKLHVWHPDIGTLVTNLTRMPLDQINFGRGAPIDFFPAGSHSPRTYILVSRPGGVEAFVGV